MVNPSKKCMSLEAMVGFEVKRALRIDSRLKSWLIFVDVAGKDLGVNIMHGLNCCLTY